MHIPENIKLFCKAALQGVVNNSLLRSQCDGKNCHRQSIVLDYSTRTVIHTCRAEGCGQITIRSIGGVV